MTHFTYRKKGGGDFFLPGIGSSTNGQMTFDKEIESSALELVPDETHQPERAPAPDQPLEQKRENEEN